MLKEIFYDNDHMYVAQLENSVYIIAHEDGTAIGSDGNHYRLISHIDDNDEVIVDGWQFAE